MFEIPDDDDNFWNDESLEDNILSKTGSLTGKENRPQLRVPDSSCTGNPAKALCTDYSRDLAVPVQTDVNKETAQFRSLVNANHHSNSVLVNKNIPNTSSHQRNITVVNTCTQNEPLGKRNPTVVNSVANVPVQEINNTAAFSDAPFHLPFPNKTSYPCDNDGRHFDGANKCSSVRSVVSMVMSDINNRDNKFNVEKDRNISERTSFPSDTNETNGIKDSARIQSETNSVTRGNRRSRSNENEADGDHVTPHRKRKFPGPAGILPKLGPGRNFDIMSPSSLNMTSPASNKSPKDDSVILCSQQTDDVFNELPWQTLITDLGEEGQTLLKKFSISSTLLKSGKKQLIQGKAALIFGIIESIESHGSEASVTIRDKSGRMQGTIHRDLLKEQEADLQAGTVLVLKQVSIISLSVRNHYLNITPSNIVVLYRGGDEGSLRSLKFHGSKDSLHSVLSALEKKAATQYNSLNSSVTMTPPSHAGSRRFGSNSGTPQQFGASPLSGLGTSTPQRFGVPLTSPITNQRLFGPHTPVMGQSPNVRTPAPLDVRNVSVVDRNMEHMNQNKTMFTPNFRNTNLQSRLNTPSASESTTTFFSTPNTNFTVVPVQERTSLPQINYNDNPLKSNHTNINNLGNTSIRLGQSNNIAKNQNSLTNHELNTPCSAGKSKWKFKSPPGRGSLPASPDISAIPGNNANNSRVPAVKSINSSTMSNIGGVKCFEENGSTGIKATASGRVNSGTASSWSFKINNNVNRENENYPGQTNKPSTHVSDENLWEDDMDDDILSQLSEDFT